MLELCGWLIPVNIISELLFYLHGGLLLRDNRSNKRDWRMRGWLILGRVRIGVCELRGRHLHSCVRVDIVHKLLGGHFSCVFRLDFVHSVHCGVLLRDGWTHSSDRSVRRG